MGDIRAGFRKAHIRYTDLSRHGDTVSVRITDAGRIDEARTTSSKASIPSAAVGAVGGRSAHMTSPSRAAAPSS